ncbi:MAG: hypothetical protein IPK64_19660 [bacterium]|nr:hypothetical protein [bacterium]
MTTTHCDYCGHDIDSRLVKEVGPPVWEAGGMACYGCRNEWKEADDLHAQDRIDAGRWRALRPLLWVAGRKGESWIESIRYLKAGDTALTVDEIVDKLVQIAREKQP